jgi:hypothetical protein
LSQVRAAARHADDVAQLATVTIQYRAAAQAAQQKSEEVEKLFEQIKTMKDAFSVAQAAVIQQEEQVEGVR